MEALVSCVRKRSLKLDMADVNRFVVAVKRSQRVSAPADWHELLKGVDGLHVVTPTPAPRMVVEGDEGAVERLRGLVGEWCHIEPVISHETHGGGTSGFTGR